MEEYTRKFNEQEGKAMSAEEFRFVSNGKTVEKESRIEELPTGAHTDIGCGAVSCNADQTDCSIM